VAGATRRMDGPLATAGTAKLQPGLGPAARCSHERLIGWRCLRTPYIACAVADDLERTTTTESLTSTDAGITTSFPGLGPLTGARVAETGGFPAADPASRMPRPTPGPCPSPAPAARPPPSCTDASKPAPRLAVQRNLFGGSSAAFTTAAAPASTTAKSPPSPRPHPQHPPEQPDNLTASDVSVPRLTPRNQRASTRDRRHPSSPH
jgi:hypothetical protein